MREDVNVPEDQQRENFLRDFVSFNEHTEIPCVFSVWSGLACISCALGRRVYINMGRFQIYPNLYVILLAPPGRFRKSTAIDVARDAIEQLDPRPNLAPSKVTPQAFYDVLHAIKKTHEAAGIVTPDSTAFAFIRELGTLLNRKAFEDGLAELLNEGFDCAKTVDYQTKGRGKETALNVCFGLLAGTT